MGIILLVRFLAPLVGIALFGWLGWRFVRARERALETGIANDEIARLHEVITGLQTEIHGLRERQDFTEKLLDRPQASLNQEQGSL